MNEIMAHDNNFESYEEYFDMSIYHYTKYMKNITSHLLKETVHR